LNKPVSTLEQAQAAPVEVAGVPLRSAATAAGPAYLVLTAISFSHFLNDTM